jgi:hypothetical protein
MKCEECKNDVSFRVEVWKEEFGYVEVDIEFCPFCGVLI